MSEIYHQYQRGEVITAQAFTQAKCGLEVFGDIVFPEWKKDQATAQYGFDKELYWQKVHPLIELTPQQEHLIRPADTREGRRQLGG